MLEGDLIDCVYLLSWVYVGRIYAPKQPLNLPYAVCR